MIAEHADRRSFARCRRPIGREGVSFRFLSLILTHEHVKGGEFASRGAVLLFPRFNQASFPVEAARKACNRSVSFFPLVRYDP